MEEIPVTVVKINRTYMISDYIINSKQKAKLRRKIKKAKDEDKKNSLQ